VSGIEPLAVAGVPIWIDRDVRVAHARTMVIDGAVTSLVMPDLSRLRNAVHRELFLSGLRLAAGEAE
jgi:hypothetical protein